MNLEKNRKKYLFKKRKDFIEQYPARWEKLIKEWSSEEEGDYCWLMRSSSYLFMTAGVRWAVDPNQIRNNGIPALDIKDLADLSFVLLSHEHGDHFDTKLITKLNDSQINWVVPYHLVEKVKDCGISKEKMLVPVMLKTYEQEGIKITPFPGLHFEEDKEGKCTGYLVECDNKRLLFPGDVRTMKADLLPSFGEIDILFAHLWLGRGDALADKPFDLNNFCNFILDLKPKRVFLTHVLDINDLGRKINDCFCVFHAEKVKDIIQERINKLKVDIPQIGECIKL